MVWRQKVAALSFWAIGPYCEAFATDNLTIATVCPDVTRRDVLVQWTTRELEARGLGDLADNFLFTAVSPISSRSSDVFLCPVLVYASRI